MLISNRLVCKAVGHEPMYYQARVMTKGHWHWQNYDRCARCDSSDSLEIHTPGILDIPAWFYLGTGAIRFFLIEWHPAKRRALFRFFRKRAS